MSTYSFGRPCSECGTDPSPVGQLWCLICKALAVLGLSPDWLMIWLAHFITLAWALTFELERLQKIRQLVKTLRPKMPGFHKFQSDHRPRVLVLLAQALIAILIQTHYVDWIAKEDTPIWDMRWMFTAVFFMCNAHFRVFFNLSNFYCQDPAKVQQSISADSAEGPFYLYRDGWKRYPTLEALIQSLDVKPKSQ